MAPKVLLATTCRWFSTARIAMAFRRIGCELSIVCPPDHPAFSTHAIQHRFRYHGVSALQSFRNAILESRPDILVPCDDVATRHLHRLYATVSQSSDPDSKAICKLIHVSMGDPVSYPITESREKFMALVREEGIRIPETKTVTSPDQVEQWLAQFGFPAVLKADGTSGGEGVRIVRTLSEALRAYKTLHAPLATVVAAKRTLVDRDSNCIVPWLMQHPRQVSIQRFVPGPDATVAVACWKGEVLASIDAEVLQTSKPKGPATIVRLCQDRDRLETAKKVVRRLGFTGLCGFDFMMDAARGEAHLIEMNARATQTCSLPLGPQHDLIASLCTALTGEPFSAVPLQLASDTVALFPMAWQGDRSSDLFQSSYLDLPVDEPELIRLGMKQIQFTFQEKLQQKWIHLSSKLGNTPALKTIPTTRSRSDKYEVLHLIGSNLVGGPEKQILHHAQNMQDSEYQLLIGSFHDLKDRPEVLVAAEQRKIPTLCLPGGLRPDLVHRLARMLSERKGSLLCTHGFKANVVGYLAARQTGTSHVAFVRGFTAENKRVKFYEILERQALKRADRVVCVSESQAQQIAPIRGHRRSPIVVKNAMLPPYSRPQDRPPISRNDLAIPESAFVFGSVGRLSTEKGHRFMISAFHKLRAEVPVGAQIYLIVVGDGKEEQSLKHQATQLGIREQIHFAGFQGSCTEWMQIMNCLIQPSLTEGTPNTVLEALCLKLPVIASAVGGVPDLIVDGKNGLLVPAADVDQMAAAMKKMWLSPDLRSQLAAGSEDLLREYSPAYQRQRLIDVYDEVFHDRSTLSNPS